MTFEPARKRATYQDVLDAPEHMVAEVLDGELHLMSRPRRAHSRSASGLGSFLFTRFHGLDGAGGWTILFEPELHLGAEPDILVPDIAGWRLGRLVDAPDEDEAFITVAPDWVCEVLSPGTQRTDRMKKVPIYRREQVGHVWLVEPRERLVEVFRFQGGEYVLASTFVGEGNLRAEPFQAEEIPALYLWGQDRPTAR